MPSCALADQLMDRVTFKYAEETKAVHATKILDQKIKLLLLDEQIFVVNFFIVGTLLVFHGLIFALFKIFRIAFLLGRSRGVGRRLQPAL